jgi:hypothetical protein
MSTCWSCGKHAENSYTVSYGKTLSVTKDYDSTAYTTYETTTEKYTHNGSQAVPVCDRCCSNERIKTVLGWGVTVAFYVGLAIAAPDIFANFDLNRSEIEGYATIARAVLGFLAFYAGLRTLTAMVEDKNEFVKRVAIAQLQKKWGAQLKNYDRFW